MKKLVFWSGVFVAFFCFSSCKSNRIKGDLLKIIGKEVFIPDDLVVTINGRDTVWSNYNDSKAKFVVWYDSAACASCLVSRMYEWDEIITFTNHVKDLNTLYIFSPYEKDLFSLKLSLQTYPSDFPVLLDKNSAFSQNNPHISLREQFHTFLLDKDNRVVLVGNPLGNEKLWELYKEQIRTLVNER